MNRKKQQIALASLGRYFMTKGKVYDHQEYLKADDKPLIGPTIKRLFKTYNSMIIEFQKTSYWAELNKPKAAPKPKAKPAPKVAKAKPAVKSAVKKGVKDE